MVWRATCQCLKHGAKAKHGGRWSQWASTYLVRQGQGQLELVGGSLSVAAALGDGCAESSRAGGTEGRSGNAEGVHGDDSWIGGTLIDG